MEITKLPPWICTTYAKIQLQKLHLKLFFKFISHF